MSLHINNRKFYSIFLAIFSALFSGEAKAQLFDFISDYVEQEVTRYINNYIRSAGSNLWENFVDYSAQSSLQEKSASLADFKGYNPEINTYRSYPFIIVTNGYINTDGTLAGIKQRTISQFNEELYSASDIKFSNMGNGILQEKCLAYLAQEERAHKVKELSDVLNAEVMSFIEKQGSDQAAIALLMDLNNNPGLIPILNNTPKAIEYYYKLIDANVRANPTELQYWAEQADYYREDMPKKTKLINPSDLVFTPDNDIISISHNGKTLATYIPSKKQYIVYYPEFLNFSPRANHSYEFENTTFSTEEMGRIASIRFSSNKKNNKTKQKNPVKYNDITKAINGSNKKNLYTELLKQYNVAPAAAYAIDVIPTKDFKTNLKLFNKEIKQSIKSGAVPFLTINLSYSDYKTTPAGISIHPNASRQGTTLR